MDLERAVSFPDWKRVLEAETGLDRAVRSRYRWAIGEYLGHLKETKQRASLATAKAYFDGGAGNEMAREAVRWFFIAEERTRTPASMKRDGLAGNP